MTKFNILYDGEVIHSNLSHEQAMEKLQDMCGEDVSFCLDAIDEGWDIWCDPRIRVGHEKTRVI